MKTCGNCGMSNKDENLFCIGCGQALNATQPNVTPIPPAPMQPTPYTSAPVPFTYGQPAESYAYPPVQLSSDSMHRIRDLGASPLMLTLVILWFVQVVLSILNSLFGMTALPDILANSGLGYDRFGILDAFSSSYIGVSSLTTMLPSILIGVGLLMAYRSAGNRQVAMSPSGFTMIRVITIVQFVFSCVIIAVLLLAAILILAGGLGGYLENYLNLEGFIEEFGDGTDLGGFSVSGILNVIGAILLVGVLIGGAVMIAFFVILLKFLGSIVATIRNGIPQEKCSTAVSVIAFIIGGLSAFGLFGTLTQVALNPALGLLGFAASAAEAALYIVMGILVVRYKQAVYSTY